jgi:hypothetical protein
MDILESIRSWAWIGVLAIAVLIDLLTFREMNHGLPAARQSPSSAASWWHSARR